VRGNRSGGDLNITWIRRTRAGGDGWEAQDVPLGESAEHYEIDIYDGPAIVRTLAVESPAVIYTAAQQTADFGAPRTGIDVAVFQISPQAGRGTGRRARL